MALDVHGTVTSMVAHQHLAAGAKRSDDGATGTARAVRSAPKHGETHDSVDMTRSASLAQGLTVLDLDDADRSTALTTAQILADPAAAVQAQGNSIPQEVFALVS